MLALCVALVYSRHEVAQLNAVIHDMEKAAWEADVAAREKQRELENEWQQKADAAAAKAAQNLLEVQTNYEESLQSLYGLLADYTDSMALDGSNPADGVQSDYTGGNSAALPAASGAAGGTGKSAACKCGGTDTAGFRRLLERQLTIARDCDINDKYLHQWAEFYQGVRAAP